MSEQQEARPRTSVALATPVRDRLAAFERALAAKENRYVSASDAVDRLLDFADAADLP